MPASGGPRGRVVIATPSAVAFPGPQCETGRDQHDELASAGGKRALVFLIRLAIGAHLRVIAGGKPRERVVRGAYSYLSYNDDRTHFGLGTATSADSLDVRWPDGTRQSITGPIAADRRIRVVRGRGLVEVAAGN